MDNTAMDIISALRSWAGLSTKSVQVDNHSIAYLEGGNGDAVLLLHGFGADKDNWHLFSKNLTENYHVIAPDLPGFGDSSKIWNDTYDTKSQVKRLHGFVKKIGLKKFHLAGNSLGGLIAAAYTVTYPDEVLTLGLLDPAGVINDELSPYFRELQKGNNPLVVESAPDYDTLLRFVYAHPPVMPDELRHYYAETAVQNKDFKSKIFVEASPERQLEEIMGKIHAKTLIIWGDTDRIFPVSMAKVLERGIKDAKVIIMKDCGHLPMLERPEETAKYYLEFIGS